MLARASALVGRNMRSAAAAIDSLIWIVSEWSGRIFPSMGLRMSDTCVVSYTGGLLHFITIATEYVCAAPRLRLMI